MINAIKEEIVSRVQDISHDKGTSMTEKLDKLIEDTLGKKMCYVALLLTLVKHCRCELCVFLYKLSSSFSSSTPLTTRYILQAELQEICMLYKHDHVSSPAAAILTSSRILRAFTLRRSMLRPLLYRNFLLAHHNQHITSSYCYISSKNSFKRTQDELFFKYFVGSS